MNRIGLTGIAVGGIALVQLFGQCLSGNAADAAHRGDRHGMDDLADAHEHRLGNCHRERQTDREAGAPTGFGVDLQGSAELADFTVDHVHADTTARQTTDLGGGAEAGLQDEGKQFAAADFGIGTEQSSLDRLAPDGIGVQAATIIGHHDHHFRSFASDRDGDRALFRFATARALLGGFQAMGDGIAQHVLQRRGHAIEDVAVHFALGAFDPQLHLLAQFASGLPQHTAHAWHDRLEGHHAGAHQPFLQVGADP